MQSQKRVRNFLIGYSLLFPSLILFLLFYLYPIFYSLYLSFFEWDLVTPARLVGLGNYRELFSSPEFLETFGNTVKFSGGVVLLTMILGLVLALFLNNRTKLAAFFRACIFTSYIVSWVAVSLLWIWLLDPQYGLISYLLRLVGLSPVNWLGDYRIALLSLVLVTVWKIIGYAMVIFLAGLQSINQDYYEATALDGATSWQQFRYITWPLLAPTTVFLLITLTIASFQGFDIVKIMTQGGPVYSTTIYVYYVYEQAFNYFKLGKASAAVTIFFNLILFLTLFQYIYLRRKLSYGA
jgi:sn-glycerol 3-phosphate transport system permease protein